MRQKSKLEHWKKLLFFKLKLNVNYIYDGTGLNFLDDDSEICAFGVLMLFFFKKTVRYCISSLNVFSF